MALFIYEVLLPLILHETLWVRLEIYLLNAALPPFFAGNN